MTLQQDPWTSGVHWASAIIATIGLMQVFVGTLFWFGQRNSKFFRDSVRMHLFFYAFNLGIAFGSGLLLYCSLVVLSGDDFPVELDIVVNLFIPLTFNVYLFSAIRLVIRFQQTEFALLTAKRDLLLSNTTKTKALLKQEMLSSNEDEEQQQQQQQQQQQKQSQSQPSSPELEKISNVSEINNNDNNINGQKTEQTVHSKQKLVESRRNLPWYVKYRERLTDERIKKAFLVFSSLMCLLLLVIGIIFYLHDYRIWIPILQTFAIGLYCLIFLVVSARLWYVHDALFIKKEFIVVTVWWVIACSLSWLVVAGVEAFQWSLVISAAAITGWHFMCVIFPLIMSFYERKRKPYAPVPFSINYPESVVSKPQMDGLEAILDEEGLYLRFLNFLNEQWNIEYLLFLHKAKQFKATRSRRKRLFNARTIHQMFFQDNAPFLLRLKHETRWTTSASCAFLTITASQNDEIVKLADDFFAAAEEEVQVYLSPLVSEFAASTACRAYLKESTSKSMRNFLQSFGAETV